MSVQGTGVVVTAGGPGSGAASARDLAAKRVAVSVARCLTGLSPQDLLIEPQQVACRVLGLCDPRGKGTSGQGLVLDGGTVRS